MDESKPPISLSEFRLQSGSGRTGTGIDPAPAELVNSGEFAAVEPQSGPGHLEVRRNDSPDEPSVAVYSRNEAEVREGFLIVLRAMGAAAVEQLPAPAKPPIRGAKP